MQCHQVIVGMVRTAAAVVLATALAVPLASCTGQTSGAGDDATAAASADSSGWETVGDALSQSDSKSAGWGDEYYVAVVEVGDSVYRVVAQMDEDATQKVDAVDWSRDDVSEQLDEAVSALSITKLEDLTADKLSADELEALVGKTGSELVDEGFVFQDYYMYGGEETGANFCKGYLAYMVTFDVMTSEDATEDGGASVMDGHVTSIECAGGSNSATDPSLVE